MFKLFGKISDRIHSGDISSDAVKYKRGSEPPPSPEAIKGAKGRGLGKGAERRRNGGAGGANE